MEAIDVGVVDGVPWVTVRAPTRAACQRLAFEIGAYLPVLPGHSVAYPTQQGTGLSICWRAGFCVSGLDSDAVAAAVAQGVALLLRAAMAHEDTPVRHTSLALLKDGGGT